MATVTIPKKFTKGEALVILPLKEYEKFLELAKNKVSVSEADILRWSREAKKLKKAGKLATLHSLKDLQ